MCSIHKTENYLVIKREILPSDTWMDLENITLSEKIRQRKKKATWPHLCVEPKREREERKQNLSSQTTEKRLVVARGACMLSYVWLFVTPWTTACQASLSTEFSRQEYQSGLPFPSPRDLPAQEIKPKSPASHALAGRFLINMCVLGRSVASDPLQFHVACHSSVHGIFQARIMEWLPFPTSGDLPNTGVESESLASHALVGRLY